MGKSVLSSSMRVGRAVVEHFLWKYAEGELCAIGEEEGHRNGFEDEAEISNRYCGRFFGLHTDLLGCAYLYTYVKLYIISGNVVQPRDRAVSRRLNFWYEVVM